MGASRCQLFLAKHKWKILTAVVFVVGIALNAVDAFFPYLWFDESYSVALASHTFADIWRIGAKDVHPVLYYWMLHLVYLVFGQSLWAMRLFSVAGVASCAGLSCAGAKELVGKKSALVAAALVFVSPWSILEATDIRMYSWAAAFVMLCWVFALKIAGALARDEHVQPSWWIACFAGALAAAYSHYFGAMAAFFALICLLGATITSACRHRKVNPKGKASPHPAEPLGFFCAGALACLIAYLPWISALAGQAKGVSEGYWIHLSPYDYDLIVRFPFVSYTTGALSQGEHGIGWTLPIRAALLGLYALVLAGVVVCVVRAIIKKRSRSASSSWPADVLSRVFAHPAVAGFWVFWATFGLSYLAGCLLGQEILMPRYLYVCIGPLCVAFAWLWDRVGRFAAPVGAVLCAVLAVGELYWESKPKYDAANERVDAYLMQKVDELGGEGAPIVSDDPIGTNIMAVGPLSLECELPMTICSTAPAYEAYSPRVRLVDDVSASLSNYHGKYLYITGDKELVGVDEFCKRSDSHIVSAEFFWRPYKSNGWSVVVLERP